MSPGGTTRLTLTPDGKGLAGKTPADLTRAMELLSSLGVSIQAGEGGGGEKGAAAATATSPPQQQSLNTRALLSPRFTSSSPTSPQPTSPVSPSSPTATSPQPTSPPPIPPPPPPSQPEPAAASSSPPASSRWTLTAEHRLLYGAAFESTVAVDGGYMPRARAMRHMSKSNLPAYLLEHAMALVTSISGSGAAGASEGEGAISEIQFVIAMLLVSKGPPLPEVLPIELQEEILTASVNAANSASTIAAPPPPLPPLPPLPVIPKLPKLPPAAAHASTSIFAQLGGREEVEVVVEVGDAAHATETKSKNPFYLEAVAAAAEVVEVSDAAAAETKQSPSPPPQQQPRPWQWTTSDTVEVPPPPQQQPPPRFVVRIGQTSSGKTRCTILSTHPKALPPFPPPTTWRTDRTALGAKTRERMLLQLQSEREDRDKLSKETTALPTIPSLAAIANMRVEEGVEVGTQCDRRLVSATQIALTNAQRLSISYGGHGPLLQAPFTTLARRIRHPDGRVDEGVQAALPWSTPALQHPRAIQLPQPLPAFNPLHYAARIVMEDGEVRLKIVDAKGRPWDVAFPGW